MSKTAQPFKGIGKNVVVLGAASLLTDVSSEMLYPIIPIFLTSVLGAPMSVVGLIEGIAESTGSTLKAISGWLSDRIGKRRPFVIAGYALSSFAKPILLFAYVWPVVLVSRFFDRFGKGLRTAARDAMLADSTEVSYRGKAFGFHRAMDSAGACIGPLLAIWFLRLLKDNLRLVFLISFIPAALAVLTLIFFLRETPVILSQEDKIRKIDLKRFGPNFKKFLIASSIFAIGNSSDAFLILRARSLGLSMAFVILAYVLYNISYSTLATPLGALSDKISRSYVMIMGYSIFALVYVGFAIIAASRWLWPLFFIYGFYMAMTDGVGKALVSDMVGRGHRATALGLYHFVLGIFSFFASLIAGLLWTHLGAPAPFLYGAATAIAASLALFSVKRKA